LSSSLSLDVATTADPVPEWNSLDHAMPASRTPGRFDASGSASTLPEDVCDEACALAFERDAMCSSIGEGFLRLPRPDARQRQAVYGDRAAWGCGSAPHMMWATS
jgi:hypothetical protein